MDASGVEVSPHGSDTSQREKLDPDDIRMQRKTVSASSISSPPRTRTSAASSMPGVKIGSFVKVEVVAKDPHADHGGSRLNRVLRYLNGSWIPNAVALVIVFDLIVTCIDVDERAAGRTLSPVLNMVMQSCVIVYTLEFAVNLKLYKLALFKDWMSWIDGFVIFCGWLEMIMYLTEQEALYFLRDIRMLRVIRICRLANFIRKVRAFRELKKMIHMLSTTTRTLAWSLLFCFGMMTLWAMLLVELVHPLCCSDPAADSCNDCVDCAKATGSIMDANLLLFKTVIAGDSWGKIAVPIIEASPYTAILFCGSLLTLVFGVMNLVVAVVVDTFAEVRDRDMLNLAEELELTNEDDKKQLLKMFERIERQDGDGVTLDELIQGVRKDRDLQSRLRVMDIDEEDLQQLFHMIDVDGSGTVEAEEFITPLSRWVHDSKTATRFIKYNLMRHIQQQEAFIQDISFRLDRLWECVTTPACTFGSRTPDLHPHDLCRCRSDFSDPKEGAQPRASMTDPFKEPSDEVAADGKVEQPHLSVKDDIALQYLAPEVCLPSEEDVVNAALDNAQRLLAASSEELLNRALQVMSGVLHDVVSDARGPHQTWKPARIPARSLMTGRAGLQSVRRWSQRAAHHSSLPRDSADICHGRPAAAPENPFFLPRAGAGPGAPSSMRFAQPGIGPSLPVGQCETRTDI